MIRDSFHATSTLGPESIRSGTGALLAIGVASIERAAKSHLEYALRSAGHVYGSLANANADIPGFAAIDDDPMIVNAAPFMPGVPRLKVCPAGIATREAFGACGRATRTPSPFLIRKLSFENTSDRRSLTVQ